MDIIKSIDTFLRVVNCGSFAAAAEQLNRSRALVTKHVMQLEVRLDARLLNRTTRRLSLTEAGREYYRFCTNWLEELQKEEGMIARLQTEPRGALRVLSPKSFGSLHMMPAMLDFMKGFPDIQATLILNDISLRPADLVEKGFDLAIRLQVQKDLGLVARRVGTVKWVTCAAPNYLKEHGEPKTLPDLENHNCILHTLSRDAVWPFRNARGSGRLSVKVTGNIISNSVISLRQAALAGHGVARLPTYCVGADLESGALRRVLGAFSAPDEAIQVVFPHRRLLPAKARLFIDFIAKRFGSSQWDFAF